MDDIGLRTSFPPRSAAGMTMFEAEIWIDHAAGLSNSPFSHRDPHHMNATKLNRKFYSLQYSHLLPAGVSITRIPHARS